MIEERELKASQVCGVAGERVHVRVVRIQRVEVDEGNAEIEEGEEETGGDVARNQKGVRTAQEEAEGDEHAEGGGKGEVEGPAEGRQALVGELVQNRGEFGQKGEAGEDQREEETALE